MVVVAYGLSLPPAVLDAPRLGRVMFTHPYCRVRGAARLIQRAVQAGDSETGVCIMRMEEGLDTGPVYHRQRIALDALETGGSLHDKLAPLGARALLEARPGIADGRARGAAPGRRARHLCPQARQDRCGNRLASPGGDHRAAGPAFDPWPVAQTAVSDGGAAGLVGAGIGGLRRRIRPGPSSPPAATGLMSQRAKRHAAESPGSSRPVNAR